MKKKQMSKESSKIDMWQGKIDERTAFLVKISDELKDSVEKLHDKMDKSFEDLQKCVDQKFENHNHFHTNQSKRYKLYFLIIGAVTVGGCLSNPDSLKFFVNMITTILRFVGIS
jgi:hypothetical protein